MKKYLLTSMIALAAVISAEAQEYKTLGDGTTWSLEKLAEAGTYGVTRVGQDKSNVWSRAIYQFEGELTISEGDKFEMESPSNNAEKVMLKMGDNARINIEGEADFGIRFYSDNDSSKPWDYDNSVITRISENDEPYGIVVSSGQDILYVDALTFEYAGLRIQDGKTVDIHRCGFYYHNAKSASYALAFGMPNSTYTVSGCTFEECEKSAIGSGANIPVNLTIEDCKFIKNGTANRNFPQLNLTVGPQVTIRNCEIQGNPENTMVGGLVVANLMGLAGEMNTLVENNNIYDNRYGVSLYVTQNAIVRNNIIKNNNHETNPMNGGSGINVYDPYYSQNTTIMGNWIEGNLWGITVIGGKDINIGKTENTAADDYNPGQNTFLNNGFDGNVYDLYNNSTNTIYAQGNIWKTADSQTQEAIEDCIYHKNDDASLGEVIFMPFAEDTGIARMQEETGTDEAVYDLNGTRLSGLRSALDASAVKKGIVIVKQNGQYRKMVMP